MENNAVNNAVNNLVRLAYEIEKVEKAMNLIALEWKDGSKLAMARAEKMQKYLENADNDDGWYGRIVELSSHAARSRKSRVAKQGKADAFIKCYNANGKIVNRAVEVKTNGGRIENLFAKNRPAFIIYSMDVCNSTTKNKPRVVEPKIYRTDDFLNCLIENNAIKSTNGTNPERAIQVSNKGFYEWLQCNGVDYNPNGVYNLD